MCKFSYSHIDGSRSMRHRPTMFMQSYTFFLDFGVFFSFLFHLCCKKLHSWEIKVKFASKFSRIFIEHTV